MSSGAYVSVTYAWTSGPKVLSLALPSSASPLLHNTLSGSVLMIVSMPRLHPDDNWPPASNEGWYLQDRLGAKMSQCPALRN